jgi:predicted transcriptional regulator
MAKRKRKKMEAISIRLDEDIRAALDEIVEVEHRTLSGQINWVLRQYVEEWRRKKAEPQEVRHVRYDCGSK